jgi:hypothetical protein
VPDDADWAADMAERERQALIARHLRRQPPPKVAERQPVRLDRVMDSHAEGRDG